MKHDTTIEKDFMLLVCTYIMEEKRNENGTMYIFARSIADRILAETQISRTSKEGEV